MAGYSGPGGLVVDKMSRSYAEAGLQQGDLIVSVSGTSVGDSASVESVMSLISNARPAAVLTVMRVPRSGMVRPEERTIPLPPTSALTLTPLPNIDCRGHLMEIWDANGDGVVDFACSRSGLIDGRTGCQLFPALPVGITSGWNWHYHSVIDTHGDGNPWLITHDFNRIRAFRGRDGRSWESEPVFERLYLPIDVNNDGVLDLAGVTKKGDRSAADGTSGVTVWRQPKGESDGITPLLVLHRSGGPGWYGESRIVANLCGDSAPEEVEEFNYAGRGDRPIVDVVGDERGELFTLGAVNNDRWIQLSGLAQECQGLDRGAHLDFTASHEITRWPLVDLAQRVGCTRDEQVHLELRYALDTDGDQYPELLITTTCQSGMTGRGQSLARLELNTQARVLWPGNPGTPDHRNDEQSVARYVANPAAYFQPRAAVPVDPGAARQQVAHVWECVYQRPASQADISRISANVPARATTAQVMQAIDRERVASAGQRGACPANTAAAVAQTVFLRLIGRAPSRQELTQARGTCNALLVAEQVFRTPEYEARVKACSQ